MPRSCSNLRAFLHAQLTRAKTGPVSASSCLLSTRTVLSRTIEVTKQRLQVNERHRIPEQC